MCNLYSLTKGQAAICDVVCAMVDRTGNLPPLPGIFPDYGAPIVRDGPNGRELVLKQGVLAICRRPQIVELTTRQNCELLGTKPAEVRAVFRQTLEPDRARELKEQLLAAGLPV